MPRPAVWADPMVIAHPETYARVRNENRHDYAKVVNMPVLCAGEVLATIFAFVPYVLPYSSALAPAD